MDLPNSWFGVEDLALGRDWGAFMGGIDGKQSC